MRDASWITVDGNEAAASVAYRTNEVIAIYPITPASPMGEVSDVWAGQGRPNVWGVVPEVSQMQSEGGAAGAAHGALQAGALATTFTASQGLLLMIPNMYKIAGELTGFCMHVAARTLAAHALSIFGDHSDVMSCRGTGFALLASGSVQEAHDFACLGQSIALSSRVPFLHFFDGFRTSHEIQKIRELSDDDLRAMVGDEHVRAHRERALTPERPVVRGTAQNPDVFFQAREAANSFYDACAGLTQEAMNRFAELTGRRYRLFDYVGDPEAERVVVMMGSGAETAHETVEWMQEQGERVGLVRVRLYRPFDVEAFVRALPPTVKRIAVLDRTKEPGAVGDPLLLDVVSALEEARASEEIAFDATPTVVGGRYGLSSKEFTPAMVKAVFDELGAGKPRRRFTVGIVDDVTHTSLPIPELDVEPDDVHRAVFYGLGSDGTVSANKNSIKIIGEETEHQVQGYFIYDSKKAGAMTASHLRFGPRPIRSTYLIGRARFVGVHQERFVHSLDVLDCAAPGAVFLLNTTAGPGEAWERLPLEVQEQVLDKELSFYVVDAYRVAADVGLGGRINTIMQACFFAISGILERDAAIEKIKKALEKSYGKRGRETIERNFAAVDAALEHLHRVDVPRETRGDVHKAPIVPEEAPDFVQRVTSVMMAGKGDLLPVSAFPVDGTWPLGTTRWERRNIAREIPIWDAELCIQCNLCALVCPHATIRVKGFDEAALDGAPQDFPSSPCKVKGLDGLRYTVQVAPEDCTGCSLCVEVCPAKDKSNPRHKAIDMLSHDEHLERERERWDFFRELPDLPRTDVPKLDVKGSQFLLPLFEFSGACAGCGETPYLKLLTQLFGDRLLIANATGCSSIYGANLPTTPYAANADGRGPAWSNSLFEDNAEFGFGFRLAVDQHRRTAQALLQGLASHLGDELVDGLLEGGTDTEAVLSAQRERVELLRRRLRDVDDPAARELERVADHLVDKQVWLVGGDGWAYDIGYGGLDHVLATGRDVNVLILDTEVYSNTGGQASKATPLGASAKFASEGKETPKKDLGMEAMSYGHVYVARVAFGAKPNQLVAAMQEAASWRGPSLVIAYSQCVAHGYDLKHGVDQQKLAVSSGSFPLYRYDPRRVRTGQPPLVLDSSAPKTPVAEYMRQEARFRIVERQDPERYKRLVGKAQREAAQRFAVYQQLSQLTIPEVPTNGDS